MPAAHDPSHLGQRLRATAESFDGHVGYVIENLETGETHMHNEQKYFPSASVIKLPLLSAFGALDRAGQASWQETAVIEDHHRTGGSGLLQHLSQPNSLRYADAAWYALCLSDNVATNLFIERMGGPRRANDCIRIHLGEGLRLLSYAVVGETDSARSMGEVSPVAMGRFLERLVTGQAPGTERLLAITAHQVYRNMVPRYLPTPHPEGPVRRICNKTGFLPGIRGDAALVWTRGGRMLVTAFTEHEAATDASEDPGERTIATLAKLAFEAWFERAEHAAGQSQPYSTPRS